MQKIENFESLDTLKVPMHLAIGMFDGVHIGHQAVIDSCINLAQNSGGASAVLSFWPHPSHLFRPTDPTPQIMPLASKEWSLSQKTLDYLIIQDFNNTFSQIAAEDFIPYLKTKIPTLQTISVGENFRFGKGRSGGSDQLREFANKAGIQLISMEHSKFNGEIISSTRIRNLLIEKDFNAIRPLLGHPYTVIGTRQGGRGVGRTIGVPTINIAWSPELKPPYGVYAVKVKSMEHNGHYNLNGIANYGVRPTFDLEKEGPLLEVHLLGDYPEDLPESLAVELHHFMRDERKFASKELLTEQIRSDVSVARRILNIES